MRTAHSFLFLYTLYFVVCHIKMFYFLSRVHDSYFSVLKSAIVAETVEILVSAMQILVAAQ